MVDFPSNPVNGQTFTLGRKTWKFVAQYGVWDLDSTPDTYATDAVNAKASAEAARDSINTTGKVFSSTATGIAGTTNGQTFAVLDAGLQFWIVYQNNAGTALEMARSYTKAYIDGVIARSSYRNWLYVMRSSAGKFGFGLNKAGRFILAVGGDIVARITAVETEQAAQGTKFNRAARGMSVLRILDKSKTKIALEITKAGRLFSMGRDVLAEIDANKTAAGDAKTTADATALTVNSRLKVTRSNSIVRVLDKSRTKIALEVTSTGRLVSMGRDVLAAVDNAVASVAATLSQFSLLGNSIQQRHSNSIFRVLDKSKTKVGLEVTSSGRLKAMGRDILDEVDTAKTTVNTVTNNFRATGSTRGARAVVRDSQGRAPWKVNRNGRVLLWDRDVLTEIDTLNTSQRNVDAAIATGAMRAARENSAYVLYPFQDLSSKRQLKSIRRSDGKVTVLTTTGNNTDAVLTSDNQVLFVSDASGLYLQKYVSADGGSIFDTFADASKIATWGDSLTAGAGSSGSALGQGPYGKQLAEALSRSYYNGGIGGQVSSAIAARQGGTLSLLTVTGNQIPASGAVAVTARTVSLITSQGAQSLLGTLAGVPGTLTRATDDTYSFTRTTTGSVVDCPAATAFIPDDAVKYRGNLQILVYGRNDGGSDPTQLIALLQSSVAYLSPYYKQFLVGLVLNGTTETIGSTNYNNIKTKNDAIKAAFPNNWFDTQSPPTDAEMAALGFTPDATDLADIANGCIPTHMRNYASSDTLHLNNTGYALWALRAKQTIIAKGW